jgi:hypothetical protein
VPIKGSVPVVEIASSDEEEEDREILGTALQQAATSGSLLYPFHTMQEIRANFKQSTEAIQNYNASQLSFTGHSKISQ